MYHTRSEKLCQKSKATILFLSRYLQVMWLKQYLFFSPETTISRSGSVARIPNGLFLADLVSLQKLWPNRDSNPGPLDYKVNA